MPCRRAGRSRSAQSRRCRRRCGTACEELERTARLMGFAHCHCGLLVRQVITPTARRWRTAPCNKSEVSTQHRVRRIHMGPAGKPLYKSLYFQVIVAIVIGILLGHFYPETGTAMKPLGDGFIKLIKMIIAPIIFCTVVVGIAGMEDMKKVGKSGGYALLYFEIVSSVAPIVGLTILNVVQPGSGRDNGPAPPRTQSRPRRH